MQADTMKLLEIPFVFSQERLLESGRFIAEAKLWGYRLTLRDLQELNTLGLLVPFYRAADQQDASMVAAPHPKDYSRVARYAREGMIRDPATDDSSARWPHLRPENAGRDWWDGFLYGKWQLLGLKDALTGRENWRVRYEFVTDAAAWAQKLRNEQVAMAALSARWLPQIIGQISYSDGADRESLSAARYGSDSKTRLRAVSFPAEQLLPVAEHLLSRAHTNDPMREWWGLIRHSDHSGWFKLRGGALEAVWQRLAAEILLRAYEELAEAGELAPLRDPSAARVWTPLVDRVGAQPHADGLERSLARVGLAPHPRVLLVVEGKTEMLHLSALLQELGIGASHQVRLDEQGTSSDWPHELARSVVPRLGRVRGGHYDVDSGTTALVVAMDAEGRYWGTTESRALYLRKLQNVVQLGVQAQGGMLTQSELDALVHVRTWGQFKYELANFTDQELNDALVTVAVSGGYDVDAAELRDAIAHVRERKLDIKVVFDRMGWSLEKGALAELLLPVLIGKLDHDDSDQVNVPVIELAYDVHDLVKRFSRAGFHLEAPAESEDIQDG
ncbi:MAG: hypothetical protein PIR02_12255 [Microbacterium enclense]